MAAAESRAADAEFDAQRPFKVGMKPEEVEKAARNLLTLYKQYHVPKLLYRGSLRGKIMEKLDEFAAWEHPLASSAALVAGLYDVYAGGEHAATRSNSDLAIRREMARARGDASACA